VALGPPTVGIDAELLDGDRERFAAIREVTGRSTASARDGLDALRLWTTIEAVLKADGRGLEVDPRRVGIDGPAGMTGSTARVDGGPRFALLGIQSEGLVVTVAVPGPGSSL
jgi:4'-phosphopantetheinyl transferase